MSQQNLPDSVVNVNQNQYCQPGMPVYMVPNYNYGNYISNGYMQIPHPQFTQPFTQQLQYQLNPKQLVLQKLLKLNSNLREELYQHWKNNQLSEALGFFGFEENEKEILNELIKLQLNDYNIRTNHNIINTYNSNNNNKNNNYKNNGLFFIQNSIKKEQFQSQFVQTIASKHTKEQKIKENNNLNKLKNDITSNINMIESKLVNNINVIEISNENSNENKSLRSISSTN